MSPNAQPNAPLAPQCTGVLNENDADTADGGLNKSIRELKYANNRTYEIIWYRVILKVVSVIGAIYGVYSMFASAKIYTTIFGKS